MSFLCWGLQSWTQDSRWGLTRVEQRGRITSLALLATLLLMQPGYGCLSGLRVHPAGSCWVSHQPVLPGPSVQGCPQSILCAACAAYYYCHYYNLLGEVIYTAFGLLGSFQQVVCILKTVKSKTSFLKRSVQWHGEYTEENGKKNIPLYVVSVAVLLCTAATSLKHKMRAKYGLSTTESPLKFSAFNPCSLHDPSGLSRLVWTHHVYHISVVLLSSSVLVSPIIYPFFPAVFLLISQNPTWQTSVTEKM